jgi:adenylosuccinate synthase
MKNAYVVIGANYGDEGKGQVVHKLAKQNTNVTVVRYSGGAQAGHTVTTDDGKRHVFSHIGAGTFAGAKTWLSDEFIVNPVMFLKEHQLLCSKLGSYPTIQISPNCRVSTPYDMLMNIVTEEQRKQSGKHHGSCGCGIYETTLRCDKTNSPVWSDVINFDKQDVTDWVKTVRAYYMETCKARFGFIDDQLKLDISERFYDDVQTMKVISRLSEWDQVRQSDTIIFESSQGLLLDEKYGVFPHLTPSSVGLEVPMSYIVDNSEKGQDCFIDIRYLTRPYLTRHGAGPFPTEVENDTFIGVRYLEETNVYNEHQEYFRYGMLDIDSLFERVTMDYENNLPHSNRIDGVMSGTMSVELTCESHMFAEHIPVMLDGKEKLVTIKQLKEKLEDVVRDFEERPIGGAKTTSSSY